MNWSQRLLSALQTVLEDLFSEGDELSSASTSKASPGSPPAQEMLPQLLDEARARIDVLRIELANATARQKRIEAEWREAQTQANAVSDAVDQALLEDQEDLARSRLEQLNRIQARVTELDELNQMCVRLVSTLQEAMQTQQNHLERAQRKTLELLERERSTEALEELTQARRDLKRQISAIQMELDERQGQIARSENRIAARQDIEHRSGS